MTKMLAPHAAVWRGLALTIAADGTVDVPDDAVPDLVAHGFREVVNASDDTRAVAHDIETLSRKELVAFVRAHGGGNAITLSNAALREAARTIVANSAKDG